MLDASCRLLRVWAICRPRTSNALLILGFVLLSAVGRADESPYKGTLSGTIVNDQNCPVAGARLSIKTLDEKRLAEGVSGEDGRFRLGPMEAVYRHFADIIVEAEGFARQYVRGRSYSVFPEADFDLGVIRMDRGCSFTGQVIDYDGEPLPGAVVECVVNRSYMGNTVIGVGPLYQVMSDAQGRFRTAPLGVADRSLYVRARRREVAYVELPAAPYGERTLPPIVLKQDVPIHGTVTDSRGAPIVGAKIEANGDGDRTTSDATGKFILSGFGPNPSFQLQVEKDGYVFINWGVKGGDDGFRWHEVGGDRKSSGPVKQLDISMQRVAWIEGEAIDEETGEPVPLDRVVLCFFERKANGEIVLNGCRNSDFQQPHPGRFRLPYSHADEYHLTLFAKGYHDAEAFTPKVTALTQIEGIRVKMRKKAVDSVPAVVRQTVSGTVTNHGHAVNSGWVGLWAMRRRHDIVNAPIQRGRTVAEDPIIYASAPIRDGKYTLSVPFQGEQFYLVAESPHSAATQVGPIAIALGEEKSLDIACDDGGTIMGTVKDRPADWKDDLWVVAFTDTGIREETRVQQDGTFLLRQLPPGRYGLKVGHDGYGDTEVPHHPNIPAEAWKTIADPWKRAVIVHVPASGEIDGIELRLPGD